MPDTRFVKPTEIDPLNLKLLMKGNSQMKPVVIKPQISANSMQTFKKISNLLEAKSFKLILKNYYLFPAPLPFPRAGEGRPHLPRARTPLRGPAPGRDRCQSRGRI